jgi:large subunit ribosomal protein L17
MRHGKKVNHLSRTASHRRALLSNMAASLLLHKRITTTVAKAKALRVYIEPLITRSKNDSTHNRRVVFSYLQNKEAIKALFDEVSDKVASRPGGYTRIIRVDNRAGDNAEMAMIELVDFNEVYVKDGAKKTAAGKKRTRRAGGAAKAKAEATEVTATTEVAEPATEESTPATEEAKPEETKEKAAE